MELVLIRGLPGSGRRPWRACLRWLATNTTKPTTTLERDGAYRFDPAELPKAHAWCLDHAMGSISRGARCVVANTFTRRWEMQPYLDAAKAAGVPVRVIEARGEGRTATACRLTRLSGCGTGGIG